MNEYLAVDPFKFGGSTAKLLCISLNWGGSAAKFRISTQATSVERPYYLDVLYSIILNDLMVEPRPRKLLDQVRDAIRVKHYSYNTEKTYVYWIQRFILFHNKRHPQEMRTAEVMQFLAHLVVTEQVSVFTQNQAMNAVFFLYRLLFQQNLVSIDTVLAKRSRYL